MSKPKVLLVGESPYGTTGNSNMMAAIIKQIDRDRYDPICFAVELQVTDPSIIANNPLDINIIIANDNDENPWGHKKLLTLLSGNTDIDFILFVGIDIWRYVEIYQKLIELRDARGF